MTKKNNQRFPLSIWVVDNSSMYSPVMMVIVFYGYQYNSARQASQLLLMDRTCRNNRRVHLPVWFSRTRVSVIEVIVGGKKTDVGVVWQNV
jgi:hypothetical protein